MALMRLPRAFYDDHCSRCLPAPIPVRESERFIWVLTDDVAVGELYSDANHYSDMDKNNDDAETNAMNRNLAAAARRLLACLQQGGWTAARAKAAVDALEAAGAYEGA